MCLRCRHKEEEEEEEEEGVDALNHDPLAAEISFCCE
jgi:hypothetical protein